MEGAAGEALIIEPADPSSENGEPSLLALVTQLSRSGTVAG